MDERTKILVQLLADVDAVWIPSRSWKRPRPANVYFARLNFPNGGVPWASGSATEADRKAAQRTLEALAKAGALKVCRPHRVKTLGVKLAPEAEAEARKLVGLPGAYSAWVSARELARHSKRPDEAELLTDAWVSETTLFSGRNLDADEYRREAVLVENMMLPALVRNCVAACADARGRVCYALTPAGWAWLDAGDEPLADDLDGEPDRDAATFYVQRVRASLSRLDTVAPQDAREIGAIPMPASMGGLKLSAPWTPV